MLYRTLTLTEKEVIRSAEDNRESLLARRDQMIRNLNQLGFNSLLFIKPDAEFRIQMF
jgi:hypothetical protein